MDAHDPYLAIVKCPHCEHVLTIMVDTTTEKPRFKCQQGGVNYAGDTRWQVCAKCNTHTDQTLVAVLHGVGRWKCDRCGNMAKKLWAMKAKEN